MTGCQYACVYVAGRDHLVAEPQHIQGPLLGVTKQGQLFACLRCGAVYWVPLPKRAKENDGRCLGVTVQGRRCKLRASAGSDFCGNHSYLETQNRLIINDLVDGRAI